MREQDTSKVWVVRERERIIGAGLSYHEALTEARNNSVLSWADAERLANSVENGASVTVISGGWSIAHESLAAPSVATPDARRVVDAAKALCAHYADNERSFACPDVGAELYASLESAVRALAATTPDAQGGGA